MHSAADPPPMMHFATVDREHVIWLEDAGDRLDRLFNPEASLEPYEIDPIEHWISSHQWWRAARGSSSSPATGPVQESNLGAGLLPWAELAEGGSAGVTLL